MPTLDVSWAKAAQRLAPLRAQAWPLKIAITRLRLHEHIRKQPGLSTVDRDGAIRHAAGGDHPSDQDGEEPHLEDRKFKRTFFSKAPAMLLNPH